MTKRLITAVRVSGWIFNSEGEYVPFQHTEFDDENIFRYGLHILELEAPYFKKSQIIQQACYWLNKYTIANEPYTS